MSNSSSTTSLPTSETNPSTNTMSVSPTESSQNERDPSLNEQPQREVDSSSTENSEVAGPSSSSAPRKRSRKARGKSTSKPEQGNASDSSEPSSKAKRQRKSVKPRASRRRNRRNDEPSSAATSSDLYSYAGGEAGFVQCNVPFNSLVQIDVLSRNIYHQHEYPINKIVQWNIECSNPVVESSESTNGNGTEDAPGSSISSSESPSTNENSSSASASTSNPNNTSGNSSTSESSPSTSNNEQNTPGPSTSSENRNDGNFRERFNKKNQKVIPLRHASELIVGQVYVVLNIQRVNTRFGTSLRAEIVDDRSVVNRSFLFLPTRFRDTSEDDLRQMNEAAVLGQLHLVYRGKIGNADMIDIL